MGIALTENIASSISLLCFSFIFCLMSLKAKHRSFIRARTGNYSQQQARERGSNFRPCLLRILKSKFPHEENSSMSVCFSA